MTLTRTLCAVMLSLSSLPAVASAEDDDRAFGHMLSLVHTFVHIAAHAGSPREALREYDELLAGRNAEANRALMGLFDEMTYGMAPRNREKLAAIGRDLASICRKDIRREAAGPAPLEARKELNARGLRYHDEQQFLDAVKRNDELAVKLYVAGRGVNLAARGRDGRDALDIAVDNGNAERAALLARNLPAGR